MDSKVVNVEILGLSRNHRDQWVLEAKPSNHWMLGVWRQSHYPPEHKAPLQPLAQYLKKNNAFSWLLKIEFLTKPLLNYRYHSIEPTLTKIQIEIILM